MAKKVKSRLDSEAAVTKRLKQRRDHMPDTCIFC
jgi:hypothetical protein